MALVTVITGSASDRPVVDPMLEIFKNLGISYSLKVASAHRDPARVVETVQDAEKEGTLVFIAVAGMAAHLAGVVAAHTLKPVIGVPVSSGPIKGLDSLMSTVMMPSGIPVATVAVDGGKNAAWLAAQIIALVPETGGIGTALSEQREKMKEKLVESEAHWIKELES